MVMNRLFTYLSVAIAAMVAFSGCTKEEIKTPVSETKTVQFFAESIETKTAFGTPDGSTYPTLWTANDKAVKLSLNYASPKDADIEVSDDFITASFTAEITDDESGAYVFYAMSPASAFNSFHANNKYLSANISTTQTPLANSVDEKAQVLYAVSEQFDEMPSSVSLNFKHFTAYGKLSFVNLNLDDATVTSVTITSSVDFAGRWNYMVESGAFQENSGSSEITLSTSNTENLWFACAPVDMNNQTLTFTVNTNKGPLSKTVTLTNKKFEAGKIATMKVDMAGIEFAESVVYELVTDPSNLTVDSEIIIVAADSDVALSTTQNNNNRGQAGVTKDGNTISDPGSTVQVITIEDGTKDGTVAFNVGNGYLYAASSGSNYLKTETDLSDNSSWSVAIAEGVATIVAQGTNTRNTMQYNQSSSLFSCYGSASQKAVSIYKRLGTGSAPLPKLAAPVVTAELNGDETGIDVSWQAVENATSYVISGIGDDVETTKTSYSFEELSSGTYNVTVTAKADGYKSATSSPAKVTVPSTGGESTPKFVKVTSAPADWSGQYLIVFGTNAHATLSSKDLVATVTNLNIDNDEINSTSDLDKAIMTVAKNGEKYVMTYPDGKYFSMAKNSSGSSASKFDLSFEYTSSGVKISGVVSGTTYILYSNSGNYFRCYVDKTGTAGYTLPTLYKLAD